MIFILFQNIKNNKTKMSSIQQIIRIPKYTQAQQGLNKEISLHKTCQNCGKKYEKKEKECKFKKCAKCQNAWYCNKECQKADWKKHKKKCGNFGENPTSKAHKFGDAINIHMIEKPDTIFNIEVGNIWSYLDEEKTNYIMKTIEFEEFKTLCMENGLGHINFDYYIEELQTRNVFLHMPTKTVF